MYHLNMARSQVLPLDKRRQWIRWLLVYLVVAVLAIAAVAHRVTLSLVGLSNECHRVDQQERTFLQERSGYTSMEDCQDKTRARLIGLTTQVEALSQFRNTGKPVAGILLGLAESLPAGIELSRASLDGAGGAVSVDVYVPVGLKLDEGLSLPAVITLWEKSPLLANRVRRMTSENSEHARLDGHDYLSWRFSGAMEGGAK